MDQTLSQEQAGNQGDIFDQIGMALEELIAMVGPEDTLAALEEALNVADEMTGQGAPAVPPAAQMPANGINAALRG